MQPILDKLLLGKSLDDHEARDLCLALLNPETPDVRVAAALTALRVKGEDYAELRGFLNAMLSVAVDPGISPQAAATALDTCGTGGDGAGTFNISTAAALVCAAAGVTVFKHGNRAASSRCGSADVIEALGLRMLEPGKPARADFNFLFAPSYHPALKRLAPIRRALGFRTVFNLVGPLANPARPVHRLVGVSSPEHLTRMAGALAEIGARGCVLYGEPGLDEATPAGDFVVHTVPIPRVIERRMTAGEFGLPPCKLGDLKGGDAQDNARILRAIFAGEQGPRRDTVVLNAALAFQITGRATEPRAAAKLAQDTIDSGTVTRLMQELSA